MSSAQQAKLTIELMRAGAHDRYAPANTVGRVCLPKLGSSDYHVRVGTRAVLGKVDGDYVCADGLAPAKGESELRVERSG